MDNEWQTGLGLSDDAMSPKQHDSVVNYTRNQTEALSIHTLAHGNPVLFACLKYHDRMKPDLLKATDPPTISSGHKKMLTNASVSFDL